MAEITNTRTPTYDYSSIGSVGGDAAQSVNGQMINDIRAAEERSLIDPLVEKIDNIVLEKEKLEEIKTQVTAFEDIVSYFDLFNDENVFNQYHFDTTGNSVVFEQRSGATLENGMTAVQVETLAQKDIFQSNTISDKTNKIGITSYLGDQIVDTGVNLSDGTYTIYDEKGSSLFTAIVDSTYGGIDGGDDNTYADLTYTELQGLINGTTNLTASFNIDNQLNVSHSNQDLSFGTHFESTFGSAYNENDTITIGTVDKSIYQSDVINDTNAVVDDATYRIKDADGNILFEHTANTAIDDPDLTFSALKTLIDESDDIIATFENSRLSISHTDGSTPLKFEGFDTGSTLNIANDEEAGKKFSATKVERTTTLTNLNPNGNGKEEIIGEGTFTLESEGKSEVSFNTTATTTWEDLHNMVNSHPFYSASFNGNNLEIQASNTSLSITVSHNLDGAVVGADSQNNSVSTRTYEELAAEINKDDNLQATMEQVGIDSYRMILKSTDTGSENSLIITESTNMGTTFGLVDNKSIYSQVVELTNTISGSLTLGGTSYGNNGDTIQDLITAINAGGTDYFAEIDSDSNELKITNGVNAVSIDTNDTGLILRSSSDTNHILDSQNLKAKVDGVDFNLTTNTIELGNGINITALKEDDITEGEKSTLSVSNDTSAISVAAEAMTTTYNSLVETIKTELYDADSVIEDKDKLRTLLSDIKNILFQNYGAAEPEFGGATDEYGDVILNHSNVTNNDKNIFVFGFALDQTGVLSVDTKLLSEIANGDHDSYTFDDLKHTFTGAYENKGLGAQFADYLSNLDGYNGIFTDYESAMSERKTNLEEDKEDELERLDIKYGIMAQQFAAYSSLIAQLESSFGGLKMMIQQSTSGN